jgi:hypothetical protein
MKNPSLKRIKNGFLLRNKILINNRDSGSLHWMKDQFQKAELVSNNGNLECS